MGKIIFRMFEDLDSFISRDPAARNRLEVFLCYPGYHSILFYRFANALWRRRFFLLGRLISNFGKIFTGIEIHPGSTIGRRLFIDHGNGVVIGETSEIGNDVTIYQGVTLGGTSLEKGKRHPTLLDNVIVGSGAQVLGPITVGEGARIGANAVVLTDVPKDATMVGIPAKVAMGHDKKSRDNFTAYGTPTDELPDPITGSFETIRTQINILLERVDILEKHYAELAQFEEKEETDIEPPISSSGG